MPRTLLAVLTLLVGWLVSRESAAQPLRTVAFVDAVKFSAKATQAHDRLRASVEEALPSKSLSLVRTRRPLPDCGEEQSAMAKVAEENGASYVLRIAGKKSHDYAYDISLNVYSTILGTVRSSLATCEICDPGRMAEVASKAAGELVTSVLKEEANLKEMAKPQVAAEPLPPPPPPLMYQPPPPVPFVEAPRVVKRGRPLWMPLTMIGVGALVTVYGIVAITQDGKESSHVMTDGGLAIDRYSSKGLGIGSTLVGGVLAVGGAVWLVVTPSRSTTLSLSPNRAALNVRF